MKHCTVCKELKNPDNFYISKQGILSSKCKPCMSEHYKIRYIENRDSILKKSAEWKLNNREKKLKTHAEYKRKNKGKYAALEAKRRASKLKATPKWADLKAIEDFYNNCPEGYHVDHIVPLQGKHVCGLHVLDNLQYLPAKENIMKGNRYESRLVKGLGQRGILS